MKHSIFIAIVVLSFGCYPAESYSAGFGAEGNFKAEEDPLIIIKLNNKDKTEQSQKLIRDDHQIEDDPITEIILKTILDIKSHMHEGIPALGIPPLDPFKIPDYHFDLKEPKYKLAGNGLLSKVVIRNLSSFNVTEIKTDIKNMIINLTLEIPNFSIDGFYTLNGKAMSFFPIRGEGSFFLRPKNVQCFMTTEIGFANEHLYVKKFDFSLEIGDVYSHFDGLYGGGIVSNILNKVINAFGLTLFDKLEPTFHNQIRNVLIDELNAVLKDINLAGLANQTA